MQEIVPHIFHWTTFHPDIGQDVHSYCVTGVGPVILIDPMVPPEGLDWFHKHAKPEHIFLTNRLHYRGSDQLADAFRLTVWCHSAGLHEFTPEQKVRGFEHGEKLPGGVLAMNVDALCPEETAFLIPSGAGALALGDAVIREDTELGFVPDALMGDDATAVKQGLKSALTALLDQPFDHLLLAHGQPWVGGGKEALRKFTRVGAKPGTR